MKTLLINPSQLVAYEGTRLPPAYPPMGLLYIATVVEKRGHEVVLIDMDADNVDESNLPGVINDISPDAVGITSTTPTIHNAFKVAKQVKSQFQVPVIIGGIHPTIAPEECISDPNIDFLVQGEGEQTVDELFGVLEGGRYTEKELSQIKGLWFKNNGKAFFNGHRTLMENLDDLPLISKTVFDIKKYIPPDAIKKPVGFIMTSRGCPGTCTFCCTKQIFGRRFRTRSTENLIREIEQWVDECGVREIHIVDDAFTFNKKRTIDFCNEVRNRKIQTTFVLQNGIRADHVDEEILGLLKSIGVRTLAFGVESGSQEILNNIKKGISLDRIREAFDLAKRFGFTTWAFFMLGLPGEDEKAIMQTMRFAKELDPDIVKFLILKPYPGSEVFKELSSAGLIIEDDYSKYGIYGKPVHYLPGLSVTQIHNFQKKAYRDFYLRPSKLIKHLMRIRSWEHLMANLKLGFYVAKMMTKNNGHKML